MTGNTNIWKNGIMGVVVGDALGCPVQFKSREEVALYPVTGMRGYGTFNLPEGSWTDDSSLTIALLESIRRVGEIDLGDIMENCEIHREMLSLPEYVFPAAMLVFGYPTEQQKSREKPKRADMKHIVHENGYRRMGGEELRELFGVKPLGKEYVEWMQAFCNRKYNSDFSKEMTRSVAEYLKKFE